MDHFPGCCAVQPKPAPFCHPPVSSTDQCNSVFSFSQKAQNQIISEAGIKSGSKSRSRESKGLCLTRKCVQAKRIRTKTKTLAKQNMHVGQISLLVTNF